MPGVSRYDIYKSNNQKLKRSKKMKITTELLSRKNACEEGLNWVTSRGLIGLEAKEFAQKLFDAKKYEWMNWLFTKIFTKEQLKKYVCYAYDLWIEYVTEKYPHDEQSKPLLESMKALVINPSEKNYKIFSELRNNYRAYRADRAYRAYRAYLAYLADLADLAYLAYLAYRAYRAYRADRAYRAYLADLAYRAKMQKKIVEYGISLLE